MIPYGRQEINSEDVNAVIVALKAAFLTTGPLVDSFEQQLCHLVHMFHIMWAVPSSLTNSPLA